MNLSLLQAFALPPHFVTGARLRLRLLLCLRPQKNSPAAGLLHFTLHHHLSGGAFFLPPRPFPSGLRLLLPPRRSPLADSNSK